MLLSLAHWPLVRDSGSVCNQQRIRVCAAHRCRRRGWRPVSDIVGQLSDRLQGSAVCGVPGTSGNLPLLCQHLQLLADQGGPAHRCLQQLRLDTDGGVAAEGQHRQVQRVHEGVRSRRRRWWGRRAGGEAGGGGEGGALGLPLQSDGMDWGSKVRPPADHASGLEQFSCF